MTPPTRGKGREMEKEHFDCDNECGATVSAQGFLCVECRKIGRQPLRAAVSDPTAFWSSLTPAQALALLREAPRVAGKWETLHEVGDAERKPVHSFRKTIDDGKVASVYSVPSGRTDWSAWMSESDSYERAPAPSHDDGRQRADSALRAAGWLLVDE